MNETPRHRLPLLAAGQAQKEVTHNEALLALDRQVQLSVISRQLAAPPAAASAGAAYIVAAPGSGAWAGHAGAIASFDGYAWHFTDPVIGALAWVGDEGVFSVFDGGWSADGWPVSALRIGGRTLLAGPPATIAAPAGGSIVDAESRASIGAVIAALRAQGLLA
jgi:hypothetical protein